MVDQQNILSERCHPAPKAKQNSREHPISTAMIVPILAAIPILVALHFARMRGPWINWENSTAVNAAASSPSPNPISSFSGSSERERKDSSLDLQQIGELLPQQQAELLLERAINHNDAAIDVIHHRAESWRGHLHNTGRLFDLVIDALNIDDLRVRSAAVEIDLAANNLAKSRQSVAILVQRLQNEPERRPFALWRLGALGNRGVEPENVLRHLLHFRHDSNEQTRYWVVEGLAMLGTDATIDPLLDILAHDASQRVRERAAHNLGISGMLTRQQRVSAVPQLLNFADDDSLDSTTRAYIFSALQDISGQSFGDDVAAWRNWWVHHDSPPKRSRRTGILQTKAPLSPDIAA